MSRHADPEDARSRRVTRRLLFEVHWIRSEEVALRRLDGLDHIGLDFFKVAHAALLGDRLIRLVRVFEDSRRIASFWYLHSCRPSEVEALLRDTPMTLAGLRDLSARLKKVRNKTFVHIDKRGVFNPAAIYQDAAIKATQLEKGVEALWCVLNRLHGNLVGSTFQADEYTGDDIARLHAHHLSARRKK